MLGRAVVIRIVLRRECRPRDGNEASCAPSGSDNENQEREQNDTHPPHAALAVGAACSQGHRCENASVSTGRHGIRTSPEGLLAPGRSPHLPPVGFDCQEKQVTRYLAPYATRRADNPNRAGTR